MNDDTPHPHSEPRRITFDPTINLGHILTFVSLVIAGFVSWSTLNTRLAVLEEARASQSARDTGQDVLLRERISELMALVSKVDNRLERIAERQENRLGKP